MAALFGDVRSMRLAVPLVLRRGITTARPLQPFRWAHRAFLLNVRAISLAPGLPTGARLHRLRHGPSACFCSSSSISMRASAMGSSGLTLFADLRRRRGGADSFGYLADLLAPHGPYSWCWRAAQACFASLR